MSAAATQNPHYYKQVPPGIKTIDVYRVLHMFAVTDPCLQHAIKKLLVAGGRGAGKDITQDIYEAQLSLERYREMRAEEEPLEVYDSALGWIAYTGKECPVDLETLVCIRVENGSEFGPYYAKDYAWGLLPGGRSVVAYKVEEVPK